MYVHVCIRVYEKFLYFLILWLEDEDEALYDVIAARDVKPPEGTDIINLVPGGHISTMISTVQKLWLMVQSVYIAKCA